MDLYKKLVEIFEVSDLNLDKSNRRTLLKYAKRTKFQKRREAFYSVCEDGPKSKVAICKSDERPTWVHNLETLKTKQLRQQLKGFLKQLGILSDPKYMNVKKLSKEKNWHHVVFMDDTTKTGAGTKDGEEESEESSGRSRGRDQGRQPPETPGPNRRATRSVVPSSAPRASRGRQPAPRPAQDRRPRHCACRPRG